VTDTKLLEKYEAISARVATLETENTRLQNENRLLRQKLDQYIRHYFGGQRNEGLDKHQLELLLQGLPNVITLPAAESAFQLVKLALEREPTALGNEFAVVAQALIQLFLPAIDGVGFQPVEATQFSHRCARLPLLEDRELLLGGNAAASSALDGGIWVHLHNVKQAFQTVQISTGADQTIVHTSSFKSVSLIGA
jgi:hypothetical protein